MLALAGLNNNKFPLSFNLKNKNPISKIQRIIITILNPQLENFSNSEIVEHCFDFSREIIGGVFYSNLVVKLSQEIVVMFD